MINKTQFIESLFNNIKQRIKSNYIPYSITVCFRNYNIDSYNDRYISIKKIQTINSEYNAFYRHLTSKLMNNFTKKFLLHPITYAFIDFPGTKHGRAISLVDPKTPHVHSICLVHPDTHDKFNILRSDNFATITEHPSQSAIISIDCQPIGPTDDDLKRVISYSSKFLSDPRARDLDANAPLTNQFPIHPDELKKRKTPQERFYTCNKDLMMRDMNKYMNKKFKFQRKEHDNEFTIR